ncbi:hypothetical protein C8F04DRAFT_1105308 [Mycena alexandri]|uniref:Uncharacterized protein n=1 Tax=Mycena alexandri TaxID=1745969 RepID=A0AAD6X1I3_9AGAR|nr:hypothetical protein C8F04DRAFT_1105308 [Mycena alexandri]
MEDVTELHGSIGTTSTSGDNLHQYYEDIRGFIFLQFADERQRYRSRPALAPPYKKPSSSGHHCLLIIRRVRVRIVPARFTSHPASRSSSSKQNETERNGTEQIDLPEMRATCTLALAGIAVLAITVQAIDSRLLYTIPKGESMQQFTDCFEQTCTKGTWKPPPPKGLTFRGFLVEPGDYSGKNADTEAKIVCSWYNASAPGPNQPSITFTKEVAEYLGATKT